MKIYDTNTKNYKCLTGKALAMLLIEDDKYMYLLKTECVSFYMAKDFVSTVQDAIDLGFSISEIADLGDNSMLDKCRIEDYESMKKYGFNWIDAINKNRRFNGRYIIDDYSRFVINVRDYN